MDNDNGYRTIVIKIYKKRGLRLLTGIKKHVNDNKERSPAVNGTRKFTLGMRRYVLHYFSHTGNFLCIFIRDLHIELIFQFHD